MADKQHSTLTDTDGLHEPKGAGLLIGGTPDSGKVYVSNGAGSGVWKTPSLHYGQMNIIANAAAQTTVAATPEQLIGDDATGKWVAGQTFAITFSSVNQALAVADSGDFILDFWCSFTAPNASVTKFYFSIDGGTTLSAQTMSRTSTAVGDIGVLAARSIVALDPSNVIEIHMENSVGGSIFIQDAGMSLVQVKEG